MSQYIRQRQDTYLSPDPDEEIWEKMNASEDTYTTSPRPHSGYLSYSHQYPVRDEVWRELDASDKPYPTSPRSRSGYLTSSLAPPMTYSGSTDSSRSASTAYSSSSKYYNTLSPCHSPGGSHGYYDDESRHSTRDQSEGFSTSPNQDYLLDGHCMARLPSSPRLDTAERSNQRFICLYENCESSFSRVADLSRHQKSIHFPTKIDCPKPRCNRKGFYGFTREDHLTEHLRQYHGENLAKRASSKSKRTESKR